MGRLLRATAQYVLKKTHTSALFLHHHAAKRPHQHLVNKVTWYQRWHEWEYHSHTHLSALVVYVFIVGATVLFYNQQAFAATASHTWNFSVADEYDYDESQLEINGSAARLKAQNYTSDANTMGLWHFDESSGAVALDDSGQLNNGQVQGTGAFSNGYLNNALLLTTSGSFVSVQDSPSLTLNGQHTLEAWVKFDDGFGSGASKDAGVIDKGSYRLYYDRTSGKVNYEITASGSDTWSRKAGADVNGSWDDNGKSIVRATVIDGDNSYVGLGLSSGDAEVWRLNGTTWTKIGGDGVRSSWVDATFEDVTDLKIIADTLYASLGTNAAGDGEVWSCDLSADCASWTKIGGDGVNGGWSLNTFEQVTSLGVMGSNLYAGLGRSAGDAEVWRWNGTTWTKVGGDGVASSWNTGYEYVQSFESDGTNLYAGLGDTAGDGEVWRWNGTTWVQIGGDGLNSGWAAGAIETVTSMTYVGGNLYVGTGTTAGDADVWRWNGTAWTQVGGDALNGSWAASTYELIPSMTNDGTNVYAGLANSNGDGEVYRYNGTTWTKIGGDGVNSSWATNFGDGVYALAYNDGKLNAGLYDSASDGQYWQYDGTNWNRLGGGLVNGSWGYYGFNSVESSTTANDKLYIGTGASTAGNAQVWEYNGTSWAVIGGQGINGSWAADTYENVYTLQYFNGQVYAGLGTTAGDAEVWRYDGSNWTKIGGDGVSNSWGAGFEAVQVMAVYNDQLYAGLGNSANDAEVWRYDGANWTKVGGDSLNGGWTTNYEAVMSMVTYKGELYAGLGTSTNDAEVWRYNGSTWSKVGGDGQASSWNTNYEEAFIMRVYREKLIAGIGSGTDDAEVWSYDGTAWEKIGGDDVNGSWTAATYERVRSMAIYNGELYTGIGDTAGDGEVWRYNGSTWGKVAGNGVNGGWANTIEYVSTLIDYRGKLYAGTGNTANADAAVWSFGNNAFVNSSVSSHDNEWHHIAATYDGATMKLFIDGEQNAATPASAIILDNSLPLYIGSTYGSGGRGESQGYLKGGIDEVRISNVARTGFTSNPYPTERRVIATAEPRYTVGVEYLDSFVADEVTNGGAIAYQLSNDDGESWLYWGGSSWVEAESINQANTQSEVNDAIDELELGFSGVRWRAIFASDGTQRVQLNSVTITAEEDYTPPSSSATNIEAKRTIDGSTFAEGAWTNGGSPYFSWDAAFDADSGIYGYCLYLGTNASADVITTKGLLGASPADNGLACQYVTENNFLDVSVANTLSSPLTTSTDNYYLTIRAIDRAGNLSASSESFSFRFDNTPPNNPGFISSPSGFINTKEATLTWPTSGGQAANDAASGLAGLQYRIGENGTWYGENHDGSGSASDLLVNDGNYMTIPTPDYDDLIDGTNTVYFRTWDTAGNVSGVYVSAALKINTNGSPSQPQNLAATPSSNTTNSFSFSWNQPDTFVGEASTLNYCYTVNILPSLATCTFAGPGVRSLAAGAYATNPGENILYVVARDESGNINYGNYSSKSFTANTASPGIPGNVDIVDVSIKATSKWRLAITWDVPTTNAGEVSSYKVFRSNNGNDFTFAGSSTSTTYIDAGLSQQPYFYKVYACDSTNNCSAHSATVELTPTGKYTEPAAMLGEPEIANLTTKRATVSWTTDRVSDSKVAIGTKSGEYGAAEIGSSDQVSVHSIDLENLAAGTTYYYVVKWTDVDGNTGISQEFSFTTAPAPTVKSIETSKIGLTDATIKFTSINAVKINVYYGASEGFGGLKTVNTSLEESSYNIPVDGLNDGTRYYYQIAAIDSEGAEYRGNVFTFTTPQRPRIDNLRFEPLEGAPTSTQSVSWTTNVPSTSTVTFGKVGTGGRDIQDSELKTEHTIKIADLEDDSEYFLVAQSRDTNGNLAVSDQQIFRTALDTRPPTVSEIKIESSIRGSGSEAKGQVIVSWKTDEPSTSQVAYAEGSSATVFNNRSSEETQLTTDHVVVISNLPTSKVYSIQPVSYDKARNAGVGETQTEIIGRASENVMTVILNSLQRIFGL